jgi:YidC/Oxa1 family membrane protein insertase
MEQLVYLGWPLFRYINRWFTLYVFDWLKGLGINMGIVLLLMTLLVNLIVLYPRYKSYVSSAKMKALKPKVDEINAKYPKEEDAMRKQQEIMSMYSQYGVSPMGGCLPMLIQMPIWIALFNFVPNAIELRQQSFLWADDLSTYDDIIHWSANLPAIGNHLSIFCLLFCATNIISSWINMKQQDTGANPQMAAMKWMMYLMPIMFFFIFNDYSSGLCWYYFVSGLVSVIIMWIFKASTDDAKLLAKLERRRAERKTNPKLAGKSSFQERLQKLAEQQQEILRQQQEQQKRRGK